MIKLNHVTKTYGKSTAIDNLTLNLDEPKIYCLLGRNGAGKTTLMKLLSGKTFASNGEVEIGGAKVSTLNMPKNVRYIENAKSQFNLRIKELIDLISDTDESFNREFAMEMVKKFKLDERKKYNALSFGMKTMATTILTLSSNADVILLDEPVLGLDAVMRKEFYNLLMESFSQNPRIIIISTHLIDEIATSVEQIILIDKGKVILNEDINTIIEKSYKVTGLKDEVEETVKDINVIANDYMGKYSIAYVYDKRVRPKKSVEITDLSLQDMFIKMVGGENNE